MQRLSAARIAAACGTIEPSFLGTPQGVEPTLSRVFGCELVLKDETTNPLGCFKGRGADLFVKRLLAEGPVAGRLICASAGNFGLALADAGRRLGVPVTVFVSETASPFKVQRIRATGADVVARGNDFDAAKAHAREHAHHSGHTWVEDGAEVAIAEGAGTLAVELGAEGPFDTIVVPVGNGALLGGIGTWVREKWPGTRIVGVCSAGAPVMRDCWLHGLAAARPEARADTVADGIAVRVPVPAAVHDLARVVDAFVTVDDAALLAAMRTLYTLTGRAAEPSAVAGIAAVQADRDRYAGLRVATVVTGNNLTADQRAAWLA